MARSSNTETRRAEITQALLTVIGQHGYEKATIQSIALQAGLAPGLIHYHFKNKQEILVSLIDMMVSVARSRYERLLGNAAGPTQRLDAYLEARLGTGTGASSETVAAWVMIGAEAVRQGEVRSIFSRILEQELAMLTQLLGDCLLEQRRETKGAPAMAAGLLAMMEGAFQLSSATINVMPVGYAAKVAKDFVTLNIESQPKAKLPNRKAKATG